MKLRLTNFGRAKNIQAPLQVLEKYQRKPKSLRFAEIFQWVLGLILLLVFFRIEITAISLTFLLGSVCMLVSSVLSGVESKLFRPAALVSGVALLVSAILSPWVFLGVGPAAMLAYYGWYTPIVQYHRWCQQVAG